MILGTLELGNQLIVDHVNGLAEVRHILAGMTARFGDEIAEVLHDVDANGFFTINFSVGYGLPNQRIKVLIAALEIQEKA